MSRVHVPGEPPPDTMLPLSVERDGNRSILGLFFKKRLGLNESLILLPIDGGKRKC